MKGNRLGRHGDIMKENGLLEILSPAGDMERLYSALDFGADAVYLGGKMFGMRAASPNFDAQDLKTAADEVHKRGKRIYLTCNTLPRNDEMMHFEQFVKDAVDAGVDALIANDIGSILNSITLTYIHANSSVKFKRFTARRNFGVAVYNADFFAQLVDKNDNTIRFGNRTGKLTQRL